MSVYSGTVGRVYLPGTPAALTDEGMTISSDYLSFQITDFAKRVIDDGTSVVVEIDTGGGYVTCPAGAGGYASIDYLIGRVNFTSSQSGNSLRIHSGAYIPMTEAANFENWEFDMEMALVKINSFGDTWNKYLNHMRSGSGKVARMYYDSWFFTKAITPLRVIMYFLSDNTALDQKGYVADCWIKTLGIKDDAEGLVGEDVAFEFYNRPYDVPNYTA